MRKWITGTGAALALTMGAGTRPLVAQDGLENDPFAMLDVMSEMFPVEPLTAEQEARLPLAREVVGRIMPDGAMAEMMDAMMGGMLRPMREMGAEACVVRVANALGLYGETLEMDEDAAAEALAILDPSWEERQRIEMETMPGMMSEMMTTMEPVMKKAMSELYAVHFTGNELNGINAFFKTETGASYARKSFTLASDPRLISASMEAMPLMMEAFASMEERMEAATGKLPEPRFYADLTPAQKERLAQLTGMSVEKLDAGSADKEANRDAMMEDMADEM
ncbi:MAG: DUF2059 domain-containing protein [Pontixanthobacter sp.]